MRDALSPGFTDPVAGAQACFRSVLNAMARPGRVLSVNGVSAPAPLCDAAAAVLLTLLDHETPLLLDPDAEAARGWIAFHTGAPFDGATFVFALSLPDLAALPNGSDEAPETSATVILQVTALGSGRKFMLEGPGLRAATPLWVDGLPVDFVSVWQRNHGLFPRGVDLILCAGRDLGRAATQRDRIGGLRHGLCGSQGRRAGDRCGAWLAGGGTPRRRFGTGGIHYPDRTAAWAGGGPGDGGGLAV